MPRKRKKAASQPSSLRKSHLSIVPEVVELEPLTDEEKQDLQDLERKVERAFYEAGNALAQIRDLRLYRSTHHTFEEYCLDRFGFKRRHPYQLIDAAAVVDNLLGETDEEMCANGAQNSERAIKVEVLPTAERQCRPLTKLEPKEQVEAWQQAVDENQGKVPSARIVKDVVQRIRDRHPVPNPWRVGEVASIIVKENPELRGCGGCWAIIAEVHQFSCTVQMWDGQRQVRIENLKDRQYSNEHQQQVQKLADRLAKIPLVQLEKPIKDFMAGLGKLDRPWLTALEETLLADVERALS